MPDYIVRVELEGSPSGADYTNLHAAMKKAGFLQTIIGTDYKYHLPHAEYAKQNAPNQTASAVRDELRPIIATVYSNYLLLVTKAEETSWYLRFIK